MTKVGTIVKIREYRDKGLTKKATARRLGLDRKTVAKYWEGPADDPEKPRYQRRHRLTDPYEEYITDRLCFRHNRNTENGSENVTGEIED